MRILMLNGSPRPAGATAAMLAALGRGMRAAGARPDTVELRRLEIHGCIGCFACWVKTPGTCVFSDSMERLLDRIARADLLVFGTPLYHFSMTGLMKTCIDRTLPLAEPWLMQREDGLTTHPRRHRRAEPPTAMLVSPCGFPERSHFDALVATFRLLANRAGWDWAGEILRPAAGPLASPAARPAMQPYLERLAEAGQALVATRRLPAPLAAALAEDLLPGGAEAARAAGNRHWVRLLGTEAPPAGLAA